MPTFTEKLTNAWEKSGSLVCVGLDPDARKLPKCLSGTARPILEFNKAIIDATAPFACAYKPQAAYYHAAGAESDLLDTIKYIREKAPHAFVILDAKRGDIGATAEQYALEAFARYGADAVTVNPYMGGDTLQPYLSAPERGAIILCRTSNPGSGELQSLEVSTPSGIKKIYEIVAEKCAKEWNRHRNTALVIGATYPGELAHIRQLVGDIPLLVPGIGAQGGDLEAVLRNGLTPEKSGLLINSSRGIIYASMGEDFGEAAGIAARKLCEEINSFRG